MCFIELEDKGTDISDIFLSRPAAPPKPVDKTGAEASASAVLPDQAKSTCKLPAFPLPHEWKMGASIAGPVSTHVFDDTPKGASYDSKLYGHLTAPFRTVQFAENCRPLIVTIGDDKAEGRYELHSAAGLITYARPDGSYFFPGVEEKITSGAFTRSDVTLRVNRRGQILLPVNIDTDGFALVLATPLHLVN